MSTGIGIGRPVQPARKPRRRAAVPESATDQGPMRNCLTNAFQCRAGVWSAPTGPRSLQLSLREATASQGNHRPTPLRGSRTGHALIGTGVLRGPGGRVRLPRDYLHRDQPSLSHQAPHVPSRRGSRLAKGGADPTGYPCNRRVNEAPNPAGIRGPQDQRIHRGGEPMGITPKRRVPPPFRNGCRTRRARPGGGPARPVGPVGARSGRLSPRFPG